MAKIQGGKLEWDADKLVAAATAVNKRAMLKSAITVQATAKKLIGGPGTGRVYTRGKVKHRASKPGKPPARDTGILANSVSYSVTTKDGRITGTVGPDINKIRTGSPRTDPDYGFYLEVGTKKVAKRPWLRPALIKSRRQILNYFTIANRAI